MIYFMCARCTCHCSASVIDSCQKKSAQPPTFVYHFDNHDRAAFLSSYVPACWNQYRPRRMKTSDIDVPLQAEVDESTVRPS